MQKSGITAHCLVRNEENWVWYAINSVLDFVDSVIVFDTGSTDKTVEIVKTIKSSKIIFEQKGEVNKQTYAQLRQEMLDRTGTRWFLVLDGDEIWPEVTICELVTTIKKATHTIDTVVVGEWMCQGDVFHYSKEVAQLVDPNVPNMPGYRLARAIKKVPGLHVIGYYGIESYADKHNLNVSYWSKQRQVYITHKFWHMSFLPRSAVIAKDRQVMMRGPKTRFNMGVAFSGDITYPEVFYKQRPAIVPSPWRKMTTKIKIVGAYFRLINFLARRFYVGEVPISL